MFQSHPLDVPIKSDARFLPGWQISGRVPRARFNPKGTVLDADAMKYLEFKPRKGKKGRKVPLPVPAYDSKKFTPWQREMAAAIHAGDNVIADVATSCGKTWIANQTAAYETLARDSPTGAKRTCLIISPNSEVMRDSVRDISCMHTKKYNYHKRMLDTLTRNFSTFDEKRPPSCQIMIVSVECIEEFVTDPNNEDFVKNLRIIIFDEVHLPTVTRGLWWIQYIPHTAQLILLSATLGNPTDVYDTITQMQSLQEDRPRKTTIIKYDIRPIPLQPLVFKGCDQPRDGTRSKELKGAKKLACLINQFDPTVRDIRSLAGREAVVPEDREGQYHLGQTVVRENLSKIGSKLDSALEDAVVEPTVENVYNLLCYLFSNDKQPAMVFNTTAEATENMAKRLVAHIAQLEATDPEVREAQKVCDAYEKAKYRARDKGAKATGEKLSGNEARHMGARSKKSGGVEWKQVAEEDTIDKSVNIHAVRTKLQKWKFPSDLEEIKTNVPQWIKDCLEYGIGVYVSSMKVWQKHYVFDAFKQGQIRVLMSDSTISVGINLPIRTAIVCGTVPHSLYKQASGRAGRRGMDNQGYIVHLMPKDLIKKYLTTAVPEVHLKLPTRMNYSDLVRLLVPENLDKYYIGDTLNETVLPVPEYKKGILEAYLRTLSDSQLTACRNQIALIHRDQWHYHRLTNLVKILPEAASILMIKLLVTGTLHKFDNGDFIDLISMLINRVELTEESTDPDKYYLPEFEKFPKFRETLQKYVNLYGLGIDLNVPVHQYFKDFCRNNVLYTEYLTELEEIGEWLYIFKKGVLAIAPRNKHTRKYTDDFAQTISLVDELYLAARTCRSI